MRSAARGHVSFHVNGMHDRHILPLQLFAANAQIVSSNTYVGMHSLLMVPMVEEICSHGAISH